jgi:hypothetical protein
LAPDELEAETMRLAEQTMDNTAVLPQFGKPGKPQTGLRVAISVGVGVLEGILTDTLVGVLVGRGFLGSFVSGGWLAGGGQTWAPVAGSMVQPGGCWAAAFWVNIATTMIALATPRNNKILTVFILMAGSFYHYDPWRFILADNILQKLDKTRFISL